MLELRPATIEEAKLLFNWVNDSTVRENSLISEGVKWEDHLNWFENKLNTKSKIFIMYFDNIPVGQIRFDFIDGYWLIDYSIDKNFRKRGFGKKILELSISKFSKGAVLKALVKSENLGSLKVFQSLGFYELDEKDNLTIINFIKRIN